MFFPKSAESYDTWLLRQHQRLADVWTDVTGLSLFVLCRFLCLVMCAIYAASGTDDMPALVLTIGELLIVLFGITYIEHKMRRQHSATKNPMEMFEPFGQLRLSCLCLVVGFEISYGWWFVFGNGSTAILLFLIGFPFMPLVFYFMSCTPRPPKSRMALENMQVPSGTGTS